ncbi:hypothetical protein AMS68_000430 [Peltaster fructicola]|uniref:Protein SIP5 n=1 Tax=Peltaster fructicola TaxID=286661 RepID=A0A6H0XJK4_9PEZI|nr:hypothetical protein AMS68_000430 [Peltaster fructicola]
MGNSSSKDSHGGRSSARRSEVTSENETTPTSPHGPHESITTVYGPGSSSSRRGSRHEIPFLHIGRDRHAEPQAPQRPKETRQEREARRAERERQARLQERERSLKEEHIDGGYLVTLGTYTGPEDFSKPVVRQLQIERRLAPFWKGLNDHSSTWTEHQLVAAVRGLPIPAADEIPPEAQSPVQSQNLSVPSFPNQPGPSEAILSSSHPTSLTPIAPLSSSPFFRGRSKTLASLTGGAKTPLPDLTPQEINLPHDPNVNGLPIEAYLYREPGECPICFLYYPPYLNKTRCCDQPICSECFVQIKRPEPHPPEHEQPGEPRRPEEEAELLVSEVASCPFCVAPEFGITYEPPPFRRGLVYANAPGTRAALSAASSQTSFHSGERRRTISISASAPEVVTTDKVRPDWAKKLADARAHALRRSAAATALHNAAYVLGNQESLFRGGYGRRRRSIFVESTGSGSRTPGDGAGRTSSRRNRVDDLEDLMMMEAIRLSLAAEEERKRKEDKEKAKEDKKKAKEAKKEAKQLEKLAKKGGSSTSLYKTQSNDSTSTWATTSMARSTSNLGSQPAILEEQVQGKGKAPASEMLANRSRSASAANIGAGSAQRHLEESRANIQPASSTPIPMPGRRHHPRQLSNTSSLASSLGDSAPGSFRAESPSPNGSPYDGLRQDESPHRSGTPPVLEPMLNFQSLAAMIDKGGPDEHLEHAVSASLPRTGELTEGVRQRDDSGESSTSAGETKGNAEPIEHDTKLQHDEKRATTNVRALEHGSFHEATQ